MCAYIRRNLKRLYVYGSIPVYRCSFLRFPIVYIRSTIYYQFNEIYSSFYSSFFSCSPLFFYYFYGIIFGSLTHTLDTVSLSSLHDYNIETIGQHFYDSMVEQLKVSIRKNIPSECIRFFLLMMVFLSIDDRRNNLRNRKTVYFDLFFIILNIIKIL